MKQRYNYRIYPTDQQRQKLAQTFGCTRVVFNDALAMVKATPDGEKWPSNGDLQKAVITAAKRTPERQWLGDVSNVPLQQSVRDLGTAITAFFKSKKGDRKGQRVGFPRFKRKDDSQSARFTKSAFTLDGDKLYLAKIGNIKVAWSRELPSLPSSITVLLNTAGQYHISCVVEVEPVIVPAVHASVGIDLGIKTFAFPSHGDPIQSPGYARLDRKIRRFQRKLARQTKGSNRWHQTKRRIAKLHLKIANIRKDFLHKTSTRLVRDNQIISLEDLNVKGMVKNRCLARAISLQGWGMFRQMIEAKAGRYGRQAAIINRWEPTSQICSCCGYRWGKLDLSVRELVCINCLTPHDRDENAAKNIERSGVELSQDRNNWTVRECKTGFPATPVDLSTRLVDEHGQLCLAL